MTDTPTTHISIAVILRQEVATAETLRYLANLDDDLRRMPPWKRGTSWHTHRVAQRALLLARLAALGVLN
jgi:hypothetical protein